MLGLNAIQQTSKLARKGDFEAAQVHAKAWDQKMAKVSNKSEQVQIHNQYRGQMNSMYSMVNEQRIQSYSNNQ